MLITSEAEYFPDARLTSFITGLLLSNTVCFGVDSQSGGMSSQSIAESLFRSWSVGLLSASAPWRMVCAMTVSSILNSFPKAAMSLPPSPSTIHSFYMKLSSKVSRRMWAERSAFPICSLYSQSFVDLLCSTTNAMEYCNCNLEKTDVSVDAATPLPVPFQHEYKKSSFECEEGWVSCDTGWDIWTGAMEYHSVDWVTPSSSAVRSLTDSGKGPPMLREGCIVIRGLDWDNELSGSLTGDEDGKALYDKLKEDMGKKELTDMQNEESTYNCESHDVKESTVTLEPIEPGIKKNKPSLPQLPTGTIVSIEPWKGLPGLARRVKWNITNEEGLYRYGGDGGRYDIAHIEVNSKSTRVKKRYPLPESSEQCAARSGFGTKKQFSVILRCNRRNEVVILDDGVQEIIRQGILEMPDFGAGILVECKFYSDGAFSITEQRLLYGSKDSGWESRFGQPSYVPGTTIILSETRMDLNTEEKIHYVEFLGSTSHEVQNLRNRANGGKIRVTSEIRLFCDRRSFDTSPLMNIDWTFNPNPPPISFDNDFHASSLSLSRDRRTVTCTSSGGRATAFGSVGFTKGVHYWEMKIEQAGTGSVFIGVAEKPSLNSSSNRNSSGSDLQSRLEKWLGWGFVNFRATYSAGTERVYGAHYHAGDVIGVLLDCDAGRLSFFLDGVKYGEHIMTDLGCAYENISPFGFNADGCGSGGAGQGAPSSSSTHGRGGVRLQSDGAVQPKALWPVVGMRHPGDRVTFSAKWMTNKGVDTVHILNNVIKVDQTLRCFEQAKTDSDTSFHIPDMMMKESYEEYERWKEGKWQRITTRASGPRGHSSYGLDVDLDTSFRSCAAACASIGLKYALLPGDRVSIKRSSGRLLELPEEAEVLGASGGKLWYRIVLQKSEGGSLSEGGGRAWFWDESEVVDTSLLPIGATKADGIELPLINNFKCCAKGGLKIVYKDGAVMRSDLEIFEGSENIGTIPENTIIPQKDVLERRMNSCGVVRLLVHYQPVGSGWISSRIRGGHEDIIIQYVHDDSDGEINIKSKRIRASTESANVWFERFKEINDSMDNVLQDRWTYTDYDEFKNCFSEGIIANCTPLQSDSLLSSFISSVADNSPNGDALEASYELVASALFTSIKSHGILNEYDLSGNFDINIATKSFQVAASTFADIRTELPPMKCLLARIAMLRAFNRRAMYALPWLTSRPPQESSAVLGGLEGFGASIERCGKSKKSTLLSSVRIIWSNPLARVLKIELLSFSYFCTFY